MRTLFGSLVRAVREATGMGVREFAREKEIDAGQLSGFESAARSPYASLDIIDSYAEKIGVPLNERQLFRDASRLSRGELPPDIADQDGAQEFILPAIEQARKARGE